MHRLLALQLTGCIKMVVARVLVFGTAWYSLLCVNTLLSSTKLQNELCEEWQNLRNPEKE